MLVIEAYGGAINEPAPDKTAFVHRGARMDVFGWSFWMLEHQRRKAEKCINGFLDLIEPLSNGHSYQNYPNRKTPAHRYPEPVLGRQLPEAAGGQGQIRPGPTVPVRTDGAPARSAVAERPPEDPPGAVATLPLPPCPVGLHAGPRSQPSSNGVLKNSAIQPPLATGMT